MISQFPACAPRLPAFHLQRCGVLRLSSGGLPGQLGARRGPSRLAIRAPRGWALWKNAPTFLAGLPPRALLPMPPGRARRGRSRLEIRACARMGRTGSTPLRFWRDSHRAPCVRPPGRARRGPTRLAIRASRGWAHWKYAPTVLAGLPPRALPPRAPRLLPARPGAPRALALGDPRSARMGRTGSTPLRFWRDSHRAPSPPRPRALASASLGVRRAGGAGLRPARTGPPLCSML